MPSDNPLVSLILPTCDRPQLVRRALDSARAQTWPNLEILLVDANRRTPPAAENPTLSDVWSDARVRLIDGRNTRNAAMARNRALEAARGDWVTFLDDDDEYLPSKIAAQAELARRTGARLVVCGYDFIRPRRTRTRQVDQPVFAGDDILRRAHLGSPLLFHRRTEDLRFDPGLSAGEDMPYVLRLLRRHGQREIPCVPAPLVRVHAGTDGRSVHADKEAVWRAYRTAWPLARALFSPEARRGWLTLGLLERGLGGVGSNAAFLAHALRLLRQRGPGEWRLVAHFLLARRWLQSAGRSNAR